MTAHELIAKWRETAATFAAVYPEAAVARGQASTWRKCADELEAALRPVSPEPACVCHQGSVCGPACESGAHHDGCAAPGPTPDDLERGIVETGETFNRGWQAGYQAALSDVAHQKLPGRAGTESHQTTERPRLTAKQLQMVASCLTDVATEAAESEDEDRRIDAPMLREIARTADIQAFDMDRPAALGRAGTEPPPVTPDERRVLHGLLTEFLSVTDPDEHQDLHERTFALTKDCGGVCVPMNALPPAAASLGELSELDFDIYATLLLADIAVLNQLNKHAVLMGRLKQVYDVGRASGGAAPPRPEGPAVEGCEHCWHVKAVCCRCREMSDDFSKTDQCVPAPPVVGQESAG